MPPSPLRQALVSLLKRAYSGELAAAFAYRGHWRSVNNPDEKAAIREIEQDEWKHREQVHKLLAAFGERPSRFREILFWTIGKSVGLLCFVSGWFFPMFFAGRLETKNVAEYTLAAECAHTLGYTEVTNTLKHMAETEKQHESYFRNVIKTHWLTPHVIKLLTTPY